MRLIEEISLSGPLPQPELIVQGLADGAGAVLLRSALPNPEYARYSFVAANPFLTFRSWGSRCQISAPGGHTTAQFGNPWASLDALLSRYELLEEMELPFPLGACIGFWGYDLKNFVEPHLPRQALPDLDLPDCHLGFYSSLVVFDHFLSKAWIISTGFRPDGTRSASVAEKERAFWMRQFDSANLSHRNVQPELTPSRLGSSYTSNIKREQFIRAVQIAQRYIRHGHIYQVNLSHRLTFPFASTGWNFFNQLNAESPAPFAAFLNCGDFQLASSSPELFLRLNGNTVLTRPIKGTRPRSSDPLRDAQLSYELQTSPKETAELVMITDLLRNDLGRICHFGSVHVPELMRLERFSHVQHLISTVQGELAPNASHLDALSACFPGGSITGAPKVRAMEIIDELEPLARGPYTGCLGYLGFNRQSQLSILIRTGICKEGSVFFNTGAGVVHDSDPAAEYDETLAKAAGIIRALDAAPQKARAKLLVT